MHAGIIAAVLIAGQSGAPGSFWSPRPGECSSLFEVAGPPATQGQSSSSVQVATAAPGTSQQAEEDAPVHWDFSSHPRLVLGRDTFVDFRVKLQWDHRTFSPSPEDPADDAEWELGRVGVEGQVTRFVEFEVSFEVPDEADPWRAVFLNVRPLAALQVQGGHFKVPFSRERLTGPTNLDFTQRAIGVRVIAPGYDTGVMVHGRVWKRRLEYAAGLFRGDADRTESSPGGPELPGVRPLERYDDRILAWRVTGRPFAANAMPGWLRPLELGANAAYSHVDEGLNGWRGRAVFGQEFFPAYYVNGRRTRYGADAALVTGPVAVQWEYLRGLDERRGQGVADDDLPELDVRSWYVSGAVVVTGERKRDVDQPRRPLLRGGIGALEGAVRVERLSLGSRETLGQPASYSPRGVNLWGNRDTVWTAGVNWYPDRFFKVQVNAIRERVDDPERALLPGRDTFWSYVVRLQFVL